MLGGHCSKCGYHKSIGALSFHHKNPKNKEYNVSSIASGTYSIENNVYYNQITLGTDDKVDWPAQKRAFDFIYKDKIYKQATQIIHKNLHR